MTDKPDAIAPEIGEDEVIHVPDVLPVVGFTDDAASLNSAAGVRIARLEPSTRRSCALLSPGSGPVTHCTKSHPIYCR